MKKIFKVLICMLVCLASLVTLSNSVSAISFSTVSESTVLSNYSGYGFCPHFIPNVTTVEVSQGVKDANYSSDHWTKDNDVNWDEMITARLTSSSQKGTLYATYKNVGTYNGDIIDLRITLKDWTRIRKGGTSSTGKPNYPTVGFHTDRIAVHQTSYQIDSAVFVYTFYKHNTTTPVTIKFHNTFKDIDVNERLVFKDSKIEKVYLLNNTLLSYSGSTIQAPSGNSSNTDKENWAMALGNTNSFEFVYTRGQDTTADFTNGRTDERSAYWFIFDGATLGKFPTPPIAKKVSASSVSNTNSFNYTINTNIPLESTKYTEFTLTDSIAKCLTVDSYSVTGESETVTGWFNITNSANKLTFKLSNVNNASFYGKSYTFKINVHKTKGYDLSNYVSNGKVAINNSASLKTDRGTVTSNTVTTTVIHTINSSVENGTITSSNSSIPATTNKTFTYTPKSSDYILESINVDGKTVDISKYPTSYTFNNVNDNHTINVKFKRVYKIDTSVKGGSITSSVKNINGGEKRVITYKADNGKYLRRLLVDGKEIDLKQFPTSYTFDNIETNHTIEAVFLPISKVILTKQINLNEVYSASGNPIFLFKVSGKDFFGDNHTYYKSIEFTKEDIKNGINKKEVTFEMLGGNYNASEIDVSRYSLKDISNIVNGARNGNSVDINNDGIEISKATFVNTRNTYHNYNHNDLVINKFNK